MLDSQAGDAGLARQIQDIHTRFTGRRRKFSPFGSEELVCSLGVAGRRLIIDNRLSSFQCMPRFVYHGYSDRKSTLRSYDAPNRGGHKDVARSVRV